MKSIVYVAGNSAVGTLLLPRIFKNRCHCTGHGGEQLHRTVKPVSKRDTYVLLLLLYTYKYQSAFPPARISRVR